MMNTELFAAVLIKIPITTILRVIPFNRSLFHWINRKGFWLAYFGTSAVLEGERQENLHRSMVELAQFDYIEEFVRIWKFPAEQLPLMRERRTLQQAFEYVHINLPEGRSDELKQLDWIWLYNYYAQFLGQHERLVELVNHYLAMKRAAKNNNRESYERSLLQLLKLYHGKNAPSLASLIGRTLSESNNYQFLVQQLGNDHVIADETAKQLLRRGELDRVVDLDIDGVTEFPAWPYLIESDRDDSIERLVEMDRQFIGELSDYTFGNRQLMLEFMKRTRVTAEWALNHYRLFSVDELKKMVQQLGGINKSKLSRAIDQWRMNGYEYLVRRASEFVIAVTKGVDRRAPEFVDFNDFDISIR